MMKRVKFSSQVDPDLLHAMREIVDREGRQLQAVLEDAMRLYLHAREAEAIRPEFRAAFEEGVARYPWLAKKLAE